MSNLEFVTQCTNLFSFFLFFNKISLKHRFLKEELFALGWRKQATEVCGEMIGLIFVIGFTQL